MTGRDRQYRQIEVANQMLSRGALSEALVNPGNRNCFKETTQAFKFDKQGCGTPGRIYIDINGLHEVDNYLGYQVGARMLKVIPDISLKYSDSQGILRTGGDELVILCKSMGREELVRRIE